MAKGFGKRKVYHRGEYWAGTRIYPSLYECLGNNRFIFYRSYFPSDFKNFNIFLKFKFDDRCGEYNLKFLRKFL